MPRARKPAPVSGPGSLARRTDQEQPIRLPSGGPYGQRKMLREQQQAAPLPAAGGPAGAAVPESRAAPPAASNIFGATRRPGEPITAGAPVGAGAMGPLSAEGMDADRILQVMFQILPSPAIARLMTRGR